VIQIVLAVVVALIVLPVFLYAAAMRWVWLFPRLGPWLDTRATRISPRMAGWFRDESTERPER